MLLETVATSASETNLDYYVGLEMLLLSLCWAAAIVV